MRVKQKGNGDKRGRTGRTKGPDRRLGKPELISDREFLRQWWFALAHQKTFAQFASDLNLSYSSTERKYLKLITMGVKLPNLNGMKDPVSKYVMDLNRFWERLVETNGEPEI